MGKAHIRKLSFLVISLLAVASMAATAETSNLTTKEESYQHFVLAEYGTSTTCPYCPAVSELLYSIYNSSEYPFYYISYVVDRNEKAMNRMMWYLDWFVPMVYFDGGYAYCLGSNESCYISAIEECTERDVHEILLDVVATQDDNNIKIDVSVENAEGDVYIGILKVYVTEIVSRWNDYNGTPYHFAFIDFAVRKPIILTPNKTINISTTWTPTIDNLEKDNIMIFASVSNIMPHIKKNPWDRPKPTIFPAFYIDQAAATLVE